jgi:diadenosine tetraphosphatase ApaH/serine/threonine PP2A family protein phosphatase
MLIALLADIHSNREALEACLEHAAANGAAKYVFLGDYVGYGADPEWVVETIMDYVARGAVAVVGNHDLAVAELREGFNDHAEMAMTWTRGQLSAEARSFISGRPFSVEDEDRLYVHSEASAPKRWIYVRGLEEAATSIRATTSRCTFCGHVHTPAIYSLSELGKLIPFRPVTGIRVPLLANRRWLAVQGSVGQPRDGNSAAAYALFDTRTSEIAYQRVPYDIETAAEKIRKAGLPEMLAARLRKGQ